MALQEGKMGRNKRNRPQKGGGEGGLGGQTPALGTSALTPEMGEVLSTRPQLLLAADLNGLPDPDPILRAEGKDISTYRSMVDDHLTSVMSKRYAAVSARSWTLERGKASARATARVQDSLDALDIRGAIKAGLKAIGFGRSIQEVVWASDSTGWIYPAQIVERPPEWFRFGLRGETRFVDEAGLLPIMPDRKLLICRHEADALNPYGSPVLSRCFWPLAFKRGGLKLWMMFCERFGLPKTVGKVPAGTTEGERAKLLANLEAMVRAAAAVISDNGKVELLETKISGDLPFPELVHWADSAMSKAWLGETITTESNGTGSYGYAKAGLEVRADLALDDAAMIESQLFAPLVRWIWEINGLSGPMPYVQIDMPEDLQMGRIKRDMGLRVLGARFDRSYFEDVYNIAPEHLAGVDNSTPTTTGEANAFGAPGDPEPQRSDEVAAALLAQLEDGELGAQGRALVDPIIEMAGRSSGYADFLALLDREYPALEGGKLQDTLERFCTLSELGGATDGARAASTTLGSHA